MTRKDLIITLSLMCLWGLNFSAIKLGADQINPILLTALRFTFAVIPVIFFIPKPNVPLKYLLGYGLTFGVGVWGMMIWSINLGISAGMAGLLMDMSLLSSLILGYLFFKEAITSRKLIGATVAVAGLLVSLQLTDGSVSKVGLPLTFIAAFSWSVMSIIVKKSQTTQVFAFSVWGMAFAPIPLCALAFAFHGSEPFINLPKQMNGGVWFSILFQAYPTTLLGYWVWNRLTLKYPITTMAPFTLLTPIFGLFGSAIFYGEQVSALKLVAFALILSGVFLSLWQGRFRGPNVRQLFSKT